MWLIKKISANVGGFCGYRWADVPRFSWLNHNEFNALDITLYDTGSGLTVNRFEDKAQFSEMFEWVGSYHPYGYIYRQHNPVMIVVDMLAYKFLDYVDGVRRIDLKASGVDKSFIHDKVQVALFDDIGTFVAIAEEQTSYVVPLFHAVVYSPANWTPDGRFVFVDEIDNRFGYQVDFCDKRQAGTLLKRAPLEYGCDMVTYGNDQLDKLGCYGRYEWRIRATSGI